MLSKLSKVNEFNFLEPYYISYSIYINVPSNEVKSFLLGTYNNKNTTVLVLQTVEVIISCCATHVMTPFSFCILFTFVYSLCIKKLYSHFIFFGPFITYSFLACPSTATGASFFLFLLTCSCIPSFIIFSPLT